MSITEVQFQATSVEDAPVGAIEGRCQWLKDTTRREWLLKRAAELWPSLK
jgi:hypothetical protein